MWGAYMLKGLTVVSSAVVLLMGCSQVVSPKISDTIPRGTERIKYQSHKIGRVQTAYVGEPMVKVKDYVVNRYRSKVARATNDFVISSGFIKITGNTDVDYSLNKETVVDGVKYDVVDLPGGLPPGGFGVLVTPEGGVTNFFMNGGELHRGWNVYPNNLKFIAGEKREVDPKSAYLNYELLYGGSDGKSVNLTYREYSSESNAIPSYFQNISYGIVNRMIRFRNISMEVIEITNEKIVFNVISDGQVDN